MAINSDATGWRQCVLDAACAGSWPYCERSIMDQNIEWTAEPIPPSERKAALRDQRSFAGALAKVQNEARRWTWSLAGISNVTTLAVAVVMGVALYRHKPQDPTDR